MTGTLQELRLQGRTDPRFTSSHAEWLQVIRSWFDGSSEVGGKQKRRRQHNRDLLLSGLVAVDEGSKSNCFS